MPTKWQGTKEDWLLPFFSGETGKSPSVNSPGESSRMPPPWEEDVGLETSFPVHSRVPPQSWELFFLPLVLYKTLFLPWWYLYQLLWEPSTLQRIHKRIVLIAQLGSRKPYLLYCAWLNPAGNCSTIKYIFALRTELWGNSAAVLIAITYWGFPKISLACASRSISVHFPKVREVARVPWQIPAGPGMGNSWPQHFHSSTPI